MAKLVVLAVVVLGTSLLHAVASFVTGQAVLGRYGMAAAISDPNAIRSIVGSALYLTIAGVTGLALGALLRNTAAAITTFVGAFFVIPPLTMLLPATWSDQFVQYLPSNAGGMLVGGSYGVANPLPPWTGFGVMCAYAAVLVGLTAWRLRRVDA